MERHWFSRLLVVWEHVGICGYGGNRMQRGLFKYDIVKEKYEWWQGLRNG